MRNEIVDVMGFGKDREVKAPMTDEEFSEVLYHDVEFLYPATLQGTCLVVEVHKYDISVNLDYCYSLRDELIELLDDYYKIFEQ